MLQAQSLPSPFSTLGFSLPGMGRAAIRTESGTAGCGRRSVRASGPSVGCIGGRLLWRGSFARTQHIICNSAQFLLFFHVRHGGHGLELGPLLFWGLCPLDDAIRVALVDRLDLFQVWSVGLPVQVMATPRALRRFRLPPRQHYIRISALRFGFATIPQIAHN